MMIAQVCNLEVGEFIHTLVMHISYNNHFEQLELLSREPKPLPTMMKFNQKLKNIFDFTFEDFTLEGYDPHPHIKVQLQFNKVHLKMRY
jgi:thymidylate synthase